MTATLITPGGTVSLSGNAVVFCEWIASMQRDIEPIRIGSLEFHFAGQKVTAKLVRSHLLRREE